MEIVNVENDYPVVKILTVNGIIKPEYFLARNDKLVAVVNLRNLIDISHFFDDTVFFPVVIDIDNCAAYRCHKDICAGSYFIAVLEPAVGITVLRLHSEFNGIDLARLCRSLRRHCTS